MKTVRCLISDTLVCLGIFTHNEYKFDKENGHICLVDDIDVPDLLSKTRKQGCCGNPVEYIHLFEIVE